MGVFKSAVTGSDGSVDPGYLGLFWVMFVTTGSIPVMVIAALFAQYFDPLHQFHAQELGIGIGAACTGFATAAGAVGLFRMGDKERNHDPAPGSKAVTVNMEQPK